MAFMQWLQATEFAEWVRTSPSLMGYPLALTAHTIGMALMVGLVFMLDLRLLGRFQRIPFAALSRLLGLAWIGFAISLVSGSVIFTAAAVFYITNVPYLIKLVAMLAGVSVAAYMQPVLNRESANWGHGTQVPASMQVLAIVSIVLWVVTITAGRYTAYLGDNY